MYRTSSHLRVATAYPFPTNGSVPLVRYMPQYPSNSFPGLLGEIMRCIGIVCAEPQLAGTVLIAIASLLTQGIADVVWPNGQKSPIGVSGIVVAPSGSGKSLFLKLLMAAVEQCLRGLSQADEKILDFLVEDITRAAIVQSLADFPFAGLLTDEGGQLKGLLERPATLIKLLDGATLRSARVPTGRVTLIGRRLIMLLMMQPEVFSAIKPLLGLKSGGNGLGNRFFYAPCSDITIGSNRHHIGLTETVRLAYEKRVASLLDATVEQAERQGQDRPAIRLSSAATQFLFSLEDDVRRNSAPQAPLFFIAEYLSRYPERTLRLAGAMHVFEHDANGEISVSTMQNAAELAQWYAEAFAQLMYEPPRLKQDEMDAQAVELALRQEFYRHRTRQFLQSDLRLYAPNLGLTSARLTRAIAVLGGQGKIYVSKLNGKAAVELNIS